MEGNRVYMRLAKESLTEEELYKLIAYLDRKIAAVEIPNLIHFEAKSISSRTICSLTNSSTRMANSLSGSRVNNKLQNRRD